MALLLYDGFDGMVGGSSSASVMMAGKGWASQNWTRSSIAPRFGGCAVAGFLSPATWTPTSAPLSSGIIGGAFNIQVGSINDSTILAFMETGNLYHLVLTWDRDTNLLFVWRGPSGSGTVLGWGTTFIQTGTWYYVEFKATINNGAGSFEVRLNGSPTPEIAGSAVDTSANANNSFTAFAIGATSNAQASWDDVYILDLTGPAPFNDFLGDTRIQSLYPDANGSLTQWTPLSGANYEMVNDGATTGQGLDFDATYNFSTVAGKVDLFETTNITGSPIIYSVSVTWEGRKDEAGLSQVRTKLKSGGTMANGAPIALPASYATFRTRYDKDPATNDDWTVAGVNALEVGYENV